MLPIYERTVRIAWDKYLPSHNRGIQVPKEPTTVGGHLRRRRLQLRVGNTGRLPCLWQLLRLGFSWKSRRGGLSNSLPKL